jgi:hypothetical protein
VFVVPSITVRPAFYSPPGEGFAIYSLIILGLNNIKLGDPTKSTVDSGVIIVLWPVVLALHEGP